MGVNENDVVSDQRQVKLGRLPMKSTRKAVQFSEFYKYLKLPPSQIYWVKKTPLPLRTYGNTQYGDCTIAKQCVAATRMERMESRGREMIDIPDSEAIRVYTEMSNELYGGGDNGAYEDDALNRWRNPDKTFRDSKGRPFPIDAYLRLDAKNHDEVKAALALSGPKGIAICLNLPVAFSRIDPPNKWDIPEGQPLIDEWMPGSWGGHSMWANGYTKEGIILDHTWGIPNQILTWEAAAAYMDEAHVVIDSVDGWRKKTQKAVKFNLNGVIDAVNSVSSIRIAA